MQLTLKHAIKIHASRAHVFKALTEINEIAAWHHGLVEGDIAVGSVMYLTPKEGLKFGWETKKIVEQKHIAQTCIEGPANSMGKNLVFNLSDGEAGSTVVQLTDSDWADDDEHLPFCNTHWGEVLYRLKRYVEQEKP